MTPKEKAKQLVNHFIIEIDYDSVSNAVWRNPMDKNEHIKTMKDAKRYSLIVVDEILNYNNQFMQTELQYSFWKEVKQEIKKL
jgi:hypothetical protein